MIIGEIFPDPSPLFWAHVNNRRLLISISNSWTDPSNFPLTGTASATDSTTATVENDSSRTASGHRFTVDESSIYWSQQTQDDQRPQFKNDHHGKPAVVAEPDDRPLTIEQLRLPAPSPPPSSIYQTDDEHDRRRDKSGSIPERYKQVVSRLNDIALSGISPRDVDDFDDDEFGDGEVNDDDGDYDVYDGGAADRQRNNWTNDGHPNGVEDGDGYNMLTCRVDNNFYTNFRWWRHRCRPSVGDDDPRLLLKSRFPRLRIDGQGTLFFCSVVHSRCITLLLKIFIFDGVFILSLVFWLDLIGSDESSLVLTFIDKHNLKKI